MAFAAKILADSVAPSGQRLTTFELTYPRCIHSEIMTHREASKNASSSRAIPTEKLLRRVVDDPFIPIHWGKNQKGMQAERELSYEEKSLAEFRWLNGRDRAIDCMKGLLELGLHKQIVNRVIEPWMWITVIFSSTSYTNFFGVRCHKDAEPHFQKIACMARDLYEASKPRELKLGEWHLPLWDAEQDEAAVRKLNNPHDLVVVARKVSVGRCARVSYLTHDGRRDIVEDIALHDRLMNANPGHWTPFEHVAMAENDWSLRSGNFWGFTQYRKLFENEYIGGKRP